MRVVETWLTIRRGTAVTCRFAGDVLAQRIAKRRPPVRTEGDDVGVRASQERIDVTRSVHNAAYGGLVNGTLGHLWYGIGSCVEVDVATRHDLRGCIL